MPYVTGGFAWGHTHININQDPPNTPDIISSAGHYQPGWTAGMGIEFAVSSNWSAKLEYDYVDLSRHTYNLGAFALPNVNVDPRISLVKFGLNYNFGDLPLKSAASKLPESD